MSKTYIAAKLQKSREKGEEIIGASIEYDRMKYVVLNLSAKNEEEAFVIFEYTSVEGHYGSELSGQEYFYNGDILEDVFDFFID